LDEDTGMISTASLWKSTLPERLPVLKLSFLEEENRSFDNKKIMTKSFDEKFKKN